MRIIWTLLLIGLLSSCASITQPPAPATTIPWEKRQYALMQFNTWKLSGKIGIITAQNSGSASINWLENNDYYTIDLAGPLGAGALSLTGTPNSVTLKTGNGQTMSAPTPEQLLAQAWGWQLPISHLKYWVRGLPVPNIPSHKIFDAAGHLSLFTQQGWQVSYNDYRSVAALDLPTRITINSPHLKTKIVIYHWSALPPAGEKTGR